MAEILLDVYDDSTQYDVAITKTVETCTCRDRALTEVKYALLSDAVEATVEVKLVRQPDNPADSCCINGKIVAHTSIGEVMLFKCNEEEEMRTDSLQGHTIIPLASSVLAVPLESSLTINVDLHIPSTGETVKESVVCEAYIDSEHHLVDRNGHLDVKITWSD